MIKVSNKWFGVYFILVFSFNLLFFVEDYIMKNKYLSFKIKVYLLIFNDCVSLGLSRHWCLLLSDREFVVSNNVYSLLCIRESPVYQCFDVIDFSIKF